MLSYLKLIRKRLFVIMMLAVFLTAGIFIHAQLNYVYLGIDIQKVAEKWFVRDIDSMGWAANQDIKIGDEIISVDGQTISEYRFLKSSIEQAEQIDLMRQNQPISLFVVQQFQSTNMMPNVLAASTLFFVLFIFSILLYVKKRDELSAKLLIIFFLTIGIGYLSTGLSSVGDPYASVIVAAAMMLTPTLFLHFLDEYFKKNNVRIIQKAVLISFYIISGIFTFFDILSKYTVLVNILPRYVLTNVYLLWFSLGCVLMIAIMIYHYFRLRHTAISPILKYMIVGNIVSFCPIGLLYALPQAIFREGIVNPIVAALFLLFFPVVYVYLIVSKKLLDIDFILDRIRYYCLLSFVPTLLVIGSFMMFGGYDFLSSIVWIQLTLLVYVILVSLLYVKGEVEYRLKRPLLGKKVTLQTSLKSFTAKISKITDQPKLEESIVDVVMKTLTIDFAVILEAHRQTGAIAYKRFLGNVSSKNGLHELDFKEKSYDTGDSFETNDGYFMIVGKKQNALVLLWISRKPNRLDFNPDEIIWLKTLADYVTIVYENLEMVSGLVADIEHRVDRSSPSWLSRLLFLLSEKERQRLARDLHDSALQEQLLWYRKFEELLSDFDFSAEARERMMQIKEGMLDVTYQIRQTCNDLRPPFLKELGIIEAINQLCAYTRLNANFSVWFDHNRFHLRLDDEFVLTLYRVTQELLHNTTKHAEATEVQVTIHNDEMNNIIFTYRDNGVGMDLRSMDTSFRHMGLSGIRERVSGLNGEAQFRSVPGQGFELAISIPYRHEFQLHAPSLELH